MDAAERKLKMMDATMKIVAQKGLDSFSAAQAASLAEINEALVYRDFGTKENLLYQCYLMVNQQMLAQYQNEDPSAYIVVEDLEQQMYAHWRRFFLCLIGSGYKTLFYQQYRDSSYRNFTAAHQEAESYDVKMKFKSIFRRFAKREEDVEYVCTYIVDGSVLFAKRILCGEVQNTEETYQKIWQLLSGGLRSMAQEKI